MDIILVGGRKKADYLIRNLLNEGHHLTVIHNDSKYCLHITRTFGIDVYLGDGSNPHILEEADIYDKDLLISLASDDPTNLIICQLAKIRFSVKKVYTSIFNPENIKLFNALGINDVISSSHITTGIIKEMSTTEVPSPYISINSNIYAPSSVKIREGSPFIGKEFVQLPLKNIRIPMILRKGENLLTEFNTILEEGDILVTYCLQNNILNDFLKLLNGKDYEKKRS